MEKLIYLHDAIKIHPWRIDNNSNPIYISDYRKLLHEFLDHFYEKIKETKYGNNSFRRGSFYHDFSRSINNIECNNYNWDIEHIDRCIQYIHKFINTGEFNEYPTFYNGYNKLLASSRLRLFKWDNDNDCYYPIFKKKELDNMIKEIETKFNNDGCFQNYGIFSENYYNSLVSFKNKNFNKLID